MHHASRFLRALDRLAGLAIVVSMVGMVLVVSSQVFMRYVLNSSIDWAEDIGRLFFVWAMFLAIPVGVGQGAHIAIELLTQYLSPATQRLMLRVTSIACAGMMLVVAHYSIELVRQQWDEYMTTVDLSVSLYMVPVAICGVHAALHFLAIAVRGEVLRPQGSAE
jgi:TRAP-type C4-dicarboxylate transport system permease small subunit